MSYAKEMEVKKKQRNVHHLFLIFTDVYPTAIEPDWNDKQPHKVYFGRIPMHLGTEVQCIEAWYNFLLNPAAGVFM